MLDENVLQVLHDLIGTGFDGVDLQGVEVG
jgi:hypothetical protein